MIDCPEFDYDYENSHRGYFWCLHIASIVSLLVNPVIIYCIIFRSTSHMATYRWFLLFHQIVAFTCDIWINLFAQGVILIPFPAGFVLGLAKHFMSTFYIYVLAQNLVVFEQTTVIITFLYRYQAVHNAKAVSNIWKCVLLMFVIVGACNIYFSFAVDVKSEETFKDLAKNYSCVTPELRKIPGIVAIDKAEIVNKILLWIAIDTVIFLSTMTSLTIGSWTATKTKCMSTKLRQMQQRFIFQLCLQSFLPLFVVVVPIILMALVIVFDSFGFLWLNDIMLTSVSIFSIISAGVLFIMNPTYHQWLTRHFTQKKPKLQRISSVKSTHINMT